MSENTPWPPADVDTMMSLWRDGKSMAEIGRKINRSRNAVAGMLNRRRERLSIPRRTAKPVTRAKKARAASPPVMTPAEVAAAAKYIHFDDLKSNECRFAYGDINDGALLFCGLPKVAGSSYCRQHERLTHLTGAQAKAEKLRYQARRAAALDAEFARKSRT